MMPTEALTILLVEDDDGEAKSVHRAFRDCRIANPIVRAKDGLEALEVLRNDAPTRILGPVILLVDVNMPRMNGHELLSELRADPRLRKMVAFMLTTSDDCADIERAYDNNVAGYIVKDRAGEDFINLVSALESYWKIVELPTKPGGQPR